jgi:cation diffusion facilitator family transporter
MIEARNRRRASYWVLVATLWLTLLVLAVKVWAGWAAQSLSLLAEALHTLLDSFSTILSLTAVSSPYRIANRGVWNPGKREAATILTLTAFLGFTGLTLLILAVRQFEVVSEQLEALFPVQVNLPLVQLFGVIVAVSFCLAVFVRYEAGVLESPMLRLTANQLLRHAWLTLVVFLELVGIWRGYTWLDPLMAIVLVLLIIPSFWWVLDWQLPLFIRSVAIAPEALAQIARQFEGVIHCHQIRSWGVVGRQAFVEMSIVLHPDVMGSAQSIAQRIENAVRDRYGPVYMRVRIGNVDEYKALRS